MDWSGNATDILAYIRHWKMAGADDRPTGILMYSETHGCEEGCLVLVFWMHGYLVVATSQAQAGDEPGPS